MAHSPTFAIRELWMSDSTEHGTAPDSGIMSDHRRTERPDQPVSSLPLLAERWQWVKGPWGFDERQVFAVVFDAEGHMLPTIVNVPSLGERPDVEVVANIVAMTDELIESAAPRGSAAYMWARPAGGCATTFDLEWLRALDDARSGSAHRSWPVFFATDDGVRQMAPEEVG